MPRCHHGMVLCDAVDEVRQDAKFNAKRPLAAKRPESQVEAVRAALEAHDCHCYECQSIHNQ